MNNSDDILKRILLHMRYDSKNTLSENEEFVEQKKPKISVGKPELIRQYSDETNNKSSDSDEVNIFADEEDIKQYDTYKAYDGGVLLLPKGTPGKYVNVETRRNQSLTEFVEDYDQDGGWLTKTCDAFIKGGNYPDRATCYALYKRRRDELLVARAVSEFTIKGVEYSVCWPITRSGAYIPLEQQRFFVNYSSWCGGGDEYTYKNPKITGSSEKSYDGTSTAPSDEEMKANKGFAKRPGVSGGISGGKGDDLGGKLGFDLK